MDHYVLCSTVATYYGFPGLLVDGHGHGKTAKKD